MADVHYTFDVPRGKERFRELIVYVSSKCEDDPHFGATKLNKILFYADLAAFERLGTPITGMAYFRLEKGPAPYAIPQVRQNLIDEGAITLHEMPIEGSNFTRKCTVASRPADVDLFTKSELAIVDEVIADLWGKSARRVSEESHGIAWKALRHKELIPYEAAFLSDDKPTESDIAEARRLNDKYGWGLRV